MDHKSHARIIELLVVFREVAGGAAAELALTQFIYATTITRAMEKGEINAGVGMVLSGVAGVVIAAQKSLEFMVVSIGTALNTLTVTEDQDEGDKGDHSEGAS